MWFCPPLPYCLSQDYFPQQQSPSLLLQQLHKMLVRHDQHNNNRLFCFCSGFHRIPDAIRNHLDTKNRRLSVCNCEISIFIYGCLFSIPTVDVIRGFFVIHIHINRTRRHICEAKRFSDKPGKGFFPGCLDQLRIFFQGYILLIARSDQCCTSASPVRKEKISACSSFVKYSLLSRSSPIYFPLQVI